MRLRGGMHQFHVCGKGPLGGLPMPDVVISSPNMCSSHPGWWDITARLYGVPHFVLDAPHTNADPQERHISYLVDQMKEMIGFLEKTLKLTFSEEKLRERVALADEANKYY
jgi:benzoyl-CoA reductase/2-hydroxyglutaryl-CoA dehydratase subunit BcrC/BadD/HgdB